MAGEWLKFEANTPEKPEVLAITIAMGWDDPDLTVGKLMRVWRWFDQQTVNGNAPSVTAALLDRLLGVSGLCQAMADVGWLVIDEHGLTLPNFDRHNGKTAKDRALTAKRVATHKSNGKGNAAIVSDALPREEKRREEDKKESAGEPATTPVPEKQKPRAVTLAAYLDTCKALATKAIPDDHHIRRYCADAGITDEMTAIAWLRFREEHTTGARKAKRYIDWPETFANCVKSSWYGLWVCNTEGPASWTSKGLQEKRVADARRAEKEAANAPA